jgi:hypothetical protein
VWVHNCGFDQLFKVKYEHFMHRKGWERIIGHPNPTRAEVTEVLERLIGENGGQVALLQDGLERVTVVGHHNGQLIYAQISALPNGLYEVTSAGLQGVR